MVTVLKSGATKRSIQAILKKLGSKRSRKGFEAHKFCGVIKLSEDALTVQKRLRNEWK
jgi:hypothetical protein